MAKIKYVNSNNKSIEFENAAPFIILTIDGLGSPQNEMSTHKSPYQDGVTVTGTSLGPRNIVLEGKIIDSNRENRQTYRNTLISVLNPKLDGKLIIDLGSTQRQIDCKVEQAPYFSSNSEQNYQDFLINLLATDPYWKDITDKETDLVTWIPNLEFPEGEGFSTEQTPNHWLETEPTSIGFEEFFSEFGTGEGIEFGYREINQIVEIENTGDVETPIKAVFRADGTVINPLIQNMVTYEQIKIKGALQAGDELTITTGYGDKNVYLNGEKAQHYYNYLESTWLQLDPGINLIKYDAEEGINNLECRILYTPKYLGV